MKQIPESSERNGKKHRENRHSKLHKNPFICKYENTLEKIINICDYNEKKENKKMSPTILELGLGLIVCVFLGFLWGIAILMKRADTN